MKHFSGGGPAARANGEGYNILANHRGHCRYYIPPNEMKAPKATHAVYFRVSVKSSLGLSHSVYVGSPRLSVLRQQHKKGSVFLRQSETNLFSPHLRYRDDDVNDCAPDKKLRGLKDSPQPNMVARSLDRK